MKKIYVYALTAAALLSSRALGSADIGATIDFREYVKLSGERIFLGDIGDIHTSDHILRQRLECIDIGPTPPVGNKKSVKVPLVKMFLRKEKINVGSIDFTGSSMVVVETESVVVDSAMLTDVCREYIHDNFPLNHGHIKVDFPGTIRDITVKSGDIRFEVTPGSTHNMIGNILLNVFIYVNDRIVHTVQIQACVRYFDKVLVAQERIQRHQGITMGYVAAVMKELTDVRSEVVKDIDMLAGKVAKTVINPNTIITVDMLEDPVIAVRGEIITLLVENDSMKITTKGRLVENGKRGELVHVKNLKSGKTVFGILEDNNIVKVEL